ncbi:MAG: hypothetical protein UY92_C0021G0021 [Candidatus Magasanikbacteria bacterium GW2011_GWA2_56_11]|uniref:Uncharacterized protein n=1 Tax=Candidatus Magasanikbacteria bacterium GW2011_GWA2_56_11 TaxID=1619044 RepID=A0A0G2AJH9_9BACT|nr:MAG: hypothetical protein UY92_C0021G0021 [Candidatus Magasanikbacteria bacterium GW2011_GWA2_56_11]
MGNSEAADETTYIGIPEKPRRLEAVPRSADKYGKEATEIMIKNSAQEILLQIQDVVGDFFVDKDGGPPGAEFSDSSAVLIGQLKALFNELKRLRAQNSGLVEPLVYAYLKANNYFRYGGYENTDNIAVFKELRDIIREYYRDYTLQNEDVVLELEGKGADIQASDCGYGFVVDTGNELLFNGREPIYRGEKKWWSTHPRGVVVLTNDNKFVIVEPDGSQEVILEGPSVKAWASTLGLMSRSGDEIFLDGKPYAKIASEADWQKKVGAVRIGHEEEDEEASRPVFYRAVQEKTGSKYDCRMEFKETKCNLGIARQFQLWAEPTSPPFYMPGIFTVSPPKFVPEGVDRVTLFVNDKPLVDIKGDGLRRESNFYIHTHHPKGALVFRYSKKTHALRTTLYTFDQQGNPVAEERGSVPNKIEKTLYHPLGNIIVSGESILFETGAVIYQGPYESFRMHSDGIMVQGEDDQWRFYKIPTESAKKTKK